MIHMIKVKTRILTNARDTVGIAGNIAVRDALAVARRRRDRKRLEKMRESEAAAEEAARQSALSELLGEEPR